MAVSHHCDVAIVGGGLAGGLIAAALAEKRPDLRLRLIEPGAIGGNHIWSFFSSDIAADHRWIIDPFVSKSWDEYDVAFPAYGRSFAARYNSVRSRDFADRLKQRLPPETIVAQAADRIEPEAVGLADGTRIGAAAVIDARGAGDLALLRGGWQKFVGQEIRLACAHGLERPVVMDATVAQIDGYRFVYLLPFGPDRLLVEDTYYSNTSDLDVGACRERIAAYVAARGWAVSAVEHEETGVLPVTTGGDFPAYWASSGAGIAKAGVRAAFYHAMTGYSLPDAVRTAARIARADDLSGAGIGALLEREAAAHWRRGAFHRMLGRMLFEAAQPAERYRVLERFYQLDAGLIGRFYAARSTLLDKARILIGRPPVPIGRALRVLREAT